MGLKSKIRLFLSIILFSYAINSVSQSRCGEIFAHTNTYLSPNELSPLQSQTLLRGVSEGELVSVGTERGLFTVALSPQLTGCQLVDRSEEATRYNRINLDLLRASRYHDRKHYVHLRFHAGYEEWKAIAEEVGSELDSPLRKRSNWEFWRREARNRKSQNLMTREHFDGANYVLFDSAFARVQDLALSQKFQVVQLDMTTPAFIGWLKQRFSNKNHPLIVDFSNGWEEKFTSKSSFQNFVWELSKALNSGTYLILTTHRDIPSKFERERIGFRIKWDYHLYDLKQISSERDAQELVGRFFDEFGPNSIYARAASQ